ADTSCGPEAPPRWPCLSAQLAAARDGAGQANCALSRPAPAAQARLSDALRDCALEPFGAAPRALTASPCDLHSLGTHCPAPVPVCDLVPRSPRQHARRA